MTVRVTTEIISLFSNLQEARGVGGLSFNEAMVIVACNDSIGRQASTIAYAMKEKTGINAPRYATLRITTMTSRLSFICDCSGANMMVRVGVRILKGSLCDHVGIYNACLAKWATTNRTRQTRYY